jgi:hypothetical protein
MEELVVGERLQTLTGEVTIRAIRDARRVSDVFNIEVDGDHVYRLLDAGVLVHNADYIPRSLARNDSALYNAIGRLPGHTAHHIIPVSVATQPGLVRFFQKAASFGWDMNGARNGLLLDNSIRHVNSHPMYNEYIAQRIRHFIATYGDEITPQVARNYLEGVSNSMKRLLKESSGDINDLFEYVG